jgi:hypothetical protein
VAHSNGRAGSGERDACAGGWLLTVRRERGRGLTGRGGGVLTQSKLLPITVRSD